ncbi:MAG: hypothetical protein M3Y51_03430 [Actinomycetota bacterium]|nr:hypothetical protein [Actinomycetota bacterium]
MSPASSPATAAPNLRIEGLFDPLSGEHRDLETSVAHLPGETTIDGSSWWVLPGLYDADVHWPIFDAGARGLDRFSAMRGGVIAVNTACPWDRVARVGPTAVTAALAPLRLPQVIPVLSVSPDETSKGFAAWLSDHAEELLTTWPAVCKLYSYDERFDEHFDAVVAAGMRPIIYAFDDDAVDRIVGRGVPVHFRHAVTPELIERMKALPGATVQVSPHFLARVLDEHRGQLHVLPPVGDAAARAALVDVTIDRVDVLASDHNAPVAGNEGPGLDAADLFLPALLTVAAEQDWAMTDLVPKLRDTPASVFRTEHLLQDGAVIVDPTASELIGAAPGQEARRIPYVGTHLSTRVVGVVAGHQMRFV